MRYIKRTLLIFGVVFVLLVGIQSYIASRNFKGLLTNILNSNGLNVEFDSIELKQLNKLVIKNLKVKDIKDKIVINSPETVAKINMMLPSRLLRVDINNATVNLERRKDNHFNIFDVLKSTPQEKPAYDRASRLGRIYINNANLNYTDISYKDKIEKKLKNVNGFLETTKSKGFILEAKGYDNDEVLGIKLGTVTDTIQNLKSLFDEHQNDDKSRKNYYTNFEFMNIKINEKISQYVPLDLIKVKSGRLNGNLSLNNKNFEKKNVVEGSLDVKSGELDYVDYLGTIKNVDAKIILTPENIKVEGNSRLNNGKLELELDYLPEIQKLKLVLDVSNIRYEDIEKYKTLKELKLPLKGILNGKLQLNVDQKKSETTLNSKFSSNELNVNDFKFKNMSTEMVISKDQILSFNNTKGYFEHEFNGFKVKNNISMPKFEYNTKTKMGKGEFTLVNRGSDYLISQINGNLTLFPNNAVNVKFNSKKISGTVKVDTKLMTILVNTTGKENFDVKYGEQSYRVNPNIHNLLLNLKSKNIFQSGKINTNLILLNNNMLGPLKAEININNGIYNIKATSNKLAGYSLGLDLNLIGDGSKFNGDYKIFSAYGNHGVEYENLTATGQIKDLSNLNLNIDIFVEEVWFGYQRLKNVYGKLNLANNVLTIKSINNDKIDLSGMYNMKTGMLDVNGKLSNYVVYNTVQPEVNVNISELNANIYGTLNNLNGNIELLKSKTYINDEEIGDTEGSVIIKDNLLNINKLNLRNNKIFGTYDLKTGVMDLTAELDETRVSEILGIKDVTFGSISDFNLSGTLNNFNLMGDIVLGNLSVKGYKIPYVVTKINYKNGDINRLFKYGKLDIDRLEFRGENRERLFSTKTSLDLENLDMNYRLENQKFILDDSRDLKEKGYSGEVEVSLIINGNLDKYFTDLKIDSNKVTLSGFPVENLDIDIQMNNEGLNIGQLYLEYEKNPLLLNGYVEFKPLTYNLGLLAKNFNMDFLGMNKDVRTANGLANIDIVFTNSETNGKILLDNFNYMTKDGITEVQDLNIDIGVLNRKLNINRFDGGYNGGRFKLEGNLDVPGIPEDFVQTKRVEIGDFEVRANLDNVGLKYGKDIDFTVSGDAIFTEDNLIGGLNIQLGEIRNIPQFGNQEEKLSESEKAKRLKDKTIIEGFVEEVIDKVLKQYTVDLNIQTSKDFKINIQNISLAKSIKGEIIGDTRVHYNGGDISLLGDFSIIKGSFNLNGNRFDIDTADIRFNNFEDTINNMNPLVDFEASTTIGGEKITIGMNGMLNDSQITLKSSSGMTQNQILSLLAINRRTGETANLNRSDILGIEDRNEDSSTAAQNAALLNTVTDNLLNQLIFSSVTGKIGRVFGLTNFSLNTEMEQGSSENSQYAGRVKAYLQNSLYKNKIFWNTEIKIPFRYLNTSTVNNSENENKNRNNAPEVNSNLIDYNLWLNYEFPNGVGVKAGVETVKVYKDGKKIILSDYTSSERELKVRNKLNYYVGASISAKAHSFGELMRKILPAKNKEKLKTK